ncbi:MAG TPA: alpha/beta hydrolase [Rhizomicrobium sp.]|nr:alpha/beta hydrolase [Rhizomicrobium sp.]
MPLDRHACLLLEMLVAAGHSRGRYNDVEERREALRSLADIADPPGMEAIGGVRDHLMDVHDGHISLRVYSPLGEPSRLLPGILFFHGGGWVAGDLESHDGLCRRLCNQTGCRVIAVDYRLAPEHPFPFGLSDAVAVLNHVTRHPKVFGVDLERLGVAGDGAGGNLAATLCRLARDASSVAIAFQLLLCPILDVHGQSLARRELAEGYFLDSATLCRDLELYVPADCERTDLRLSPLRAEEFAGLPPAFIHTAQFDPFSEEGEDYAQRLGGFGVPVHGRCHPGMIHHFYCMPRMIPYAHEAMHIIGTEIRYAVRLPPLPERRIHRRIRPELIRA